MATCQLTCSVERGAVLLLRVCMKDVFACERRSPGKVTRSHVSISGTTRDEVRGHRRGGILKRFPSRGSVVFDLTETL